MQNGGLFPVILPEPYTMQTADRPPTSPTDPAAAPSAAVTLPDAERRALLKRLGLAAVTVPVVTVLHDAGRNRAHAS